jgi:hypothetical protein
MIQIARGIGDVQLQVADGKTAPRWNKCGALATLRGKRKLTSYSTASVAIGESGG